MSKERKKENEFFAFQGSFQSVITYRSVLDDKDVTLNN